MTTKKTETLKKAKHDKDNPYAMIRRDMLQDRTLSFEARGLLGYLLSQPSDWLIIIADLQQQCGRDKVRRILRELISAGYIKERTKIIDEKTKRITSYTPHLIYEVKTDNPDYKPLTGKPFTETQDTENPTLQNKEVQNKEVVKKEKTNTMSDKSDAGLLPYVPQSISDQQADSITDIGNGKDPKPEPKAPRKRNEVFDWLLTTVWNNNIESYDAMDKDTRKTIGARIGKVKKVVCGIHKANNTDCTAEHLKRFKVWYTKKYPDVSIPRDATKFGEHYHEFYAENKSKPKLSQEEIERRNRILATG